MNVFDILILLAVGVAVFFAIRAIRRGKTGGCSGNCSSCGMECGKKTDDDQQ